MVKNELAKEVQNLQQNLERNLTENFNSSLYLKTDACINEEEQRRY